MQNNWLTKLSTKKALLVSFGFTIILAILLNYFDSSLKTDAAPNGIISYELAQYFEKSQSILASWDGIAKMSAALSLGIDFIFLIAYSILLAGLCYLIAQKLKSRNKFLHKLGVLLAKLQFVAALFDSIENIVLIKLLLGSPYKIYSTIAFYFATFKFAIITIGLIYIITGFISLLFQKRFFKNNLKI